MMNRIQPSYADAGEISSGSRNWLSKKRRATGAVLAGVALATCTACGPGNDRQPAGSSPTIAAESLLPTSAEPVAEPSSSSSPEALLLTSFDVYRADIPPEFSELVAGLDSSSELFYGRVEFPDDGRDRALVGIFYINGPINNDSRVDAFLMVLPNGVPAVCANTAVHKAGLLELGTPLELLETIAEKLADKIDAEGHDRGSISSGFNFSPTDGTGDFELTVDCNFGERFVAAS